MYASCRRWEKSGVGELRGVRHKIEGLMVRDGSNHEMQM